MRCEPIHAASLSSFRRCFTGYEIDFSEQGIAEANQNAVIDAL
jgi:hypothetical protein